MIKPNEHRPLSWNGAIFMPFFKLKDRTGANYQMLEQDKYILQKDNKFRLEQKEMSWHSRLFSFMCDAVKRPGRFFATF